MDAWTSWIAGTDFHVRAEQALSLVVLGPQCAFRKAAIHALDEAGVSWRVAAVSPSVAGVWAAARGRLGVTVRSALGVPASLAHSNSMFGLPALGAEFLLFALASLALFIRQDLSRA